MVNTRSPAQSIEERKGNLQAESEENTSKKMGKTSQIGKILMSIDNLYQKCINRKKDKKPGIRYELNQEDLPKNFDNLKRRGTHQTISFGPLNGRLLELCIPCALQVTWHCLSWI